jgi:hypothetical protein
MNMLGKSRYERVLVVFIVWLCRIHWSYYRPCTLLVVFIVLLCRFHWSHYRSCTGHKIVKTHTNTIIESPSKTHKNTHDIYDSRLWTICGCSQEWHVAQKRDCFSLRLVKSKVILTFVKTLTTCCLFTHFVLLIHHLRLIYIGLARRTKARLLFTSTSEIYGDPDVHPQPETYHGNVNTLGPRACCK